MTALLIVFFFCTWGSGLASQCERISQMAAVEDHGTIVETSLKTLAGTWISEGCETRPGPEYVLRSYTFEPDGRYHLTQHHYWDDSCSSPKLSLFSHGRIHLRNSMVQAGASNGVPRTKNITIVPQDNNAVKELDRIIAEECPGHNWKPWRRYEEHLVFESKFEEKKKIYNLWTPIYEEINNHRPFNRQFNLHYTSGDISCLGSLKTSFNELKLIKIQLRPQANLQSDEMVMELLLGDIHSNPANREYYSPTSFQSPLFRQGKDMKIVMNHRIYHIKQTNSIPNSLFGNNRAPPHLLEKPHLPPYIFGEWTSSRCEARPLGLYLTRRFYFYSEDGTWIGEHKFFSDPFCKYPKFTVTAAGHFVITGPNRLLKGTSNIDFQIEKASLTVLDSQMILDMRLPGLCGQDDWEVDVPKELSSTNGCAQMGIILPSIQKDIVKLEMDYKGTWLLFLGQVDTDTIHLRTNQRPTAFQWPLTKCGDISSYSPELQDILQKDLFFNSSPTFKKQYISFVFLITFVLLFR